MVASVKHYTDLGFKMNLSGIVVVVPSQKMEQGLIALKQIENIEIHHSDKSSGQIVIVQEASNVDEEIRSLKKIKALPMVTYAEMVYHYIAEDTSKTEYPTAELDSENLNQTLLKLNG